jgi:photosystem II stability/assembly factor-like uncharacterized protein
MRTLYRFASTVLILAAVLIYGRLSAQTKVGTERNRWAKQAPTPTWFSLQGIAPISPTECWIASAPLLGDVGELAHTTDAGRTWTVAGWNGFVTRTTDAGTTWRAENIAGAETTISRTHSFSTLNAAESAGISGFGCGRKSLIVNDAEKERRLTWRGTG